MRRCLMHTGGRLEVIARTLTVSLSCARSGQLALWTLQELTSCEGAVQHSPNDWFYGALHRRRRCEGLSRGYFRVFGDPGTLHQTNPASALWGPKSHCSKDCFWGSSDPARAPKRPSFGVIDWGDRGAPGRLLHMVASRGSALGSTRRRASIGAAVRHRRGGSEV